MGRYLEEKLCNYCSTVSDTEETRIENTKSMITDSIKSSAEFDGLEYEIFIQGSYANNTNVKADSDIDVCVMLKSTFHAKYPDGITAENYGFVDATMNYDDYKGRIVRALNKKFGTDISVGNKSVKIKSNSYRVNADVVAAFQYRNYNILNSTNKYNFIEGTSFFSSNGNSVINYPKKHIDNGISKNKTTNGMYKKLVKIFKNVKNNMCDDKIIDSGTISSFLIESLIWQLPNEEIISHDTWDKTVKGSIYYLWNEFEKKRCDSWTEPSKYIYLFNSDRKWTQEHAKDFLLKMWNYMEYK